MAILRSDIPDIYTPLFDEVTWATFTETPLELMPLFDERTDKSKQVDVSSVSGLGVWEDVSEGQAVPEEDPVQMYNKTFTHNKKGKAFTITEEALDDDETAIMKKIDNAKAFGVGAKVCIESDLASHFNNAFTASSYAGADGVALCSSSHPKNPNEATTYYDNAIVNLFSHDGLEAMELQIANNMKDPKGIRIPIPKTGYLVHPWALRGSVMRVLAERAGERPSTTNRDINIYKKGGEGAINLQPLTSQYLTNNGVNSAWFVVFPPIGGLGGLRFYWRRKPSYDSYIDYKFGKYVFQGKMRYSSGWTGDGWRCVWGSTGAGS